MGRLRHRALPIALAALLGAAALAGCTSGPQRSLGRDGKGAWHTVRAGENLWRLSQEYGVPVEAIRGANQVEDVRGLAIGQRLWIPGRNGSSPGAVAAASSGWTGTLEQRDDGDCGADSQHDGLGFEWPLLGHLTSPFGAARSGRGHDGIDVSAAKGTPVHAAEAGKVVYAGDELGDYGRVVIVKHQGSWATVYAHNDRNLVEEGDFVEKGDAIARVGRTGNASAPHLHFEIRRSNRARDPIACLP
jgi:lipoprotein YgeR